VISLTIAKKYARALLEIGRKSANYEELGKELAGVAELLKENKELRVILMSPVYPIHVRKAIARSLAQPLSLSKMMSDFVDLLLEKKRIDHIFEMTRAYEALCDEVSGRIRATMVTAGGLAPDLVETIKGQLEVKTGKQVLLSLKEDPGIIGGIRTQVSNTIYDGSVKTQLSKFRENLYKE
jgi:F-type H+-transporting ATPase subunit delta